MKRIALILTAFILGACFANAQTNPEFLKFKGGNFYGESGTVYTDAQMLQLIGRDIYDETYVGALKQYRTGRNLIIIGGVTALAGLGGCIGILAANSTEEGVEGMSDSAIMGFYGSMLVAVLGGVALDVGIPLTIIGKSRLNWIADDYNAKQSGVSLRLTGCSAGPGVGLALVF